MARFEAYHGRTSRDHQANFDRLKNDYRMLSLCINGSEHDPRYTAVWVNVRGPQFRARHGLPAQMVQQEFDKNRQDGFLPVIVSATGPSKTSAIFAMVFEKDITPTLFRFGMSKEGFEAECERAQREGNILSWFTVYGANGDIYAGIWKRNKDKTRWTFSVDDPINALNEKFNAFRSIRVRPTLRVISPNLKYHTIWYDNSIGLFQINSGLTGEKYQEIFDDMKSKGYMPIRVSAGGQGDKTRYAAIFARRLEPLCNEWRVRGKGIDKLTTIDNIIKQFMTNYNIHALSVAIVRNGRLVFAKGFTWAPTNYPTTEATSLFRIASLTKLVTRAKIYQLYKKNLSPTDKIKTILGLTPSCGGQEDDRLKDVAVEHLVNHLGGWVERSEKPDNPKYSSVGDMINKNEEIAEKCKNGILPIKKHEISAFWSGRNMQYGPGDETIKDASPKVDTYSNYGYMLLGQIIEKKEGAGPFDYVNLVKSSIFAPLGTNRPRLARTSISDRYPGEVLYHDSKPSIFASVLSDDRLLVPLQYGGYVYENRDANGGLVMSAPDFARFLAAFDLGDSNPIKDATVPSNTMLRTTFSGANKGHRSLAFRSNYVGSDWFSFVIFTNFSDSPIKEELQERLIDIIRTTSTWDEEDLFPSVGIPSFFTSRDSMSLSTKIKKATTDENNIPPLREEDLKDDERDEGKETIVSEEGGEESIDRTNKKLIEKKLMELDDILKDEEEDI